jgi:leucyl-tRNA synthetase
MTAALIHCGAAVQGPFVGEPDAPETVTKVVAWLESRGIGNAVVNYRLRDWLISRQRYWGCPIPIVHCASCGEVPVPADQLPVLLPDVENYKPSGTGESPLATIPEFVNTTCPKCGAKARRETDTMGGFACSSWYFLRFADPHNDKMPFSREAVDYWLPVDTYVGGAEHAVMHLLYARFWTKVFYDAGLVGFTEPFRRLRNQGSVLAWTPGRPIKGEEDDANGSNEDDDEPVIDWKVLKPEEAAVYPADEIIWRWARMSKSKGNIVTPDEVSATYGADTLRMYEMFVVPFEENVEWKEEGVRGAAKFLGRVYRLIAQNAANFEKSNWRDGIALAVSPSESALRRKTHQTIAKVTDDIENFRFNTAVAALMEWVNVIYDFVARSGETTQTSAAFYEAIETLVLLISPIAPHIADELWESLGQQGFLYHHAWPKADSAVAAANEITLVVQVNGKVRDKLTVSATAAPADLERLALASPKVAEFLAGRPPKRVIVVPGKLVNVVG